MPHLGNAVLRVQVFQQDELVGEEQFRQRHIIVGRDPTMADLVIGSSKISREHLLLEHDGQRIFIHDLGSTNGIFVNGLQVDRAEVGSADAIYVGSHALRLTLVHSGAARAEALTADAPDEDSQDGVASLSDVSDVDEPLSAADAAALPRLPAAADRDSASPLHSGTPDAEWDGPHFSLVETLLDEAPAVPRDSSAAAWRIAVLKTRGATVLGQTLVRPGRRYRVPAAHVRERWGAVTAGSSPLTVYSREHDATQVRLASACRWSLRRGVGLWDEAAGVREGWALRRRGSVWVTLQRSEVLLVYCGSVTYHIRFVPAPVLPSRASRPSPWRIEKILRHAGLVSVLLHTWVFVAVGLMGAGRSKGALAPPMNLQRPSPQTTQLAAFASPVTLRASPPTRRKIDANPGGLRVPGGNLGYRAFGLLEAPLTYDPQLPAAGDGVVLKRVATFLRGQTKGFAAFIPAASGGPLWHLGTEGGISLTTGDPQRLPAAPASAVLEKSSGALAACYEHNVPRDAGLSERLAIAWLVTANGNVRTVFPSTMTVEPPLLACLAHVISGLHFARSRGPDISVNTVLVFKRVGFD